MRKGKDQGLLVFEKKEDSSLKGVWFFVLRDGFSTDEKKGQKAVDKRRKQRRVGGGFFCFGHWRGKESRASKKKRGLFFSWKFLESKMRERELPKEKEERAIREKKKEWRKGLCNSLVYFVIIIFFHCCPKFGEVI